jgi:hypothetical protein
MDKNVIVINNKSNVELFEFDNKNHLLDTYSVTGIVMSLNGEIMNDMKEKKIIPHMINEKNVTKIYDKNIEYNMEIIEKNLESDFGIFCDLVFTRNIMMYTDQKIEDKNALWILKGIELSDTEMEIYNKYNLKLSQDPKKYSNIVDTNERLMVFY